MTEHEIFDMSQRYREAELQGDTAAIDDLPTDDFRAVGPFGFVVEKPRWLDRYRNAELKYEAIEWDEVEIRRYGDAAVAIGRWDQRATHMGNPASGSFRVTQIFVRDDRDWAVCGVHFSPIAAPPQPASVPGAVPGRQPERDVLQEDIPRPPLSGHSSA